MNAYWTGKKRSPETNKKISATLKSKKIVPPSRLGAIPWNKGVKMKDLSGAKNPRWKGGTWNYYKKEAKERDDYTCQICGLRDPEIMEVDHTKPRCDYPDLCDSLENLITICPNCHRRKTNRELRERNTGRPNNKRQRCISEKKPLKPSKKNTGGKRMGKNMGKTSSRAGSKTSTSTKSLASTNGKPTSRHLFYLDRLHEKKHSKRSKKNQSTHDWV